MSRALILAGLALAGCSDLSERDTITLRAGDAMAVSRAIMTVDPQATAANDTRITTDAHVTANVMTKYRRTGSQPTPDPAPAAGAGVAVPQGGAPPPR